MATMPAKPDVAMPQCVVLCPIVVIARRDERRHVTPWG
jgi:hypothetical protein